MSYHDKVLPLTPATEYGSEPTPVIRIDEVDVPFFHDVPDIGTRQSLPNGTGVDECNGAGDIVGSDARGIAAVTPPQSVIDAGDEKQEEQETGSLGEAANQRLNVTDTITESDGSGAENERAEERDELGMKPTYRRAPLSQFGSVIKPLPALPEDPGPTSEGESL
jgi:hypothetical protein